MLLVVRSAFPLLFIASWSSYLFPYGWTILDSANSFTSLPPIPTTANKAFNFPSSTPPHQPKYVNSSRLLSLSPLPLSLSPLPSPFRGSLMHITLHPHAYTHTHTHPLTSLSFPHSHIHITFHTPPSP